MRISPLAPGLSVISGYANGNILVIEGPDQLLLVDAQSDRRVGLADSALRTVTPKPVRQVVFTHYHDDHTLGMGHWRTRGATAVAHANVGPQQAKDTVIAEWENWRRTAAPAGARPDATFQDSVALTIGERTVWVHHVPAAHTDGDAIVRLPWANLMHVGDLVEPGAPLFIDYWGGGSIEGMIAAADWILARADESTRIVPGHGRVIGAADVREHRRMLVTVRDRIRIAMAAGRTLEQLQEEGVAREFEPLLGGPRGATRFVRLMWVGVRRESP